MLGYKYVRVYSGIIIVEAQLQQPGAEERRREASQGVKATSDTALKTGDMGLSKHQQTTQLNRQNTIATQ